MKYVIIDPAGHVVRTGHLRPGATLPAGALVVVQDPKWVATPGQIGVDHAVSLGELGMMMQSGDWLVARPSSPQPVASTGQIDVPACPAGTVIEVFDLSGGERMFVEPVATEGWTETFTFADPGRYRVEVSAPAPALPTSIDLEVT